MQLQLREHGQPGLCHTRHNFGQPIWQVQFWPINFFVLLLCCWCFVGVVFGVVVGVVGGVVGGVVVVVGVVVGVVGVVVGVVGRREGGCGCGWCWCWCWCCWFGPSGPPDVGPFCAGPPKTSLSFFLSSHNLHSFFSWVSSRGIVSAVQCEFFTKCVWAPLVG